MEEKKPVIRRRKRKRIIKKRSVVDSAVRNAASLRSSQSRCPLDILRPKTPNKHKIIIYLPFLIQIL